MILPDVNVLVYAHRRDAPDHARHLDWLERVVDSEVPFGLSDHVLAGFLRVVTHPKIFTPPTPLHEALAFVDALRAQPNCVPVTPGARHWTIFVDLCRQAAAKGNLIPDAWLAALAIESGLEFVTTDRGFARYPGLRWRAP